jgi:hypothetical protein
VPRRLKKIKKEKNTAAEFVSISSSIMPMTMNYDTAIK